MKRLNHLFWTLATVMIFYVGTAQEQSKKIEIESVETTFSAEINADTTLEDLEFLKKLFQEDFNTTITFDDVKMIDNKIVALKLKVFNENQSYVKSIIGTTPISPFSITVKATDDEKFRIDMEQQNALGNHSGFMMEDKNLFDSFFNRTPDIYSHFSRLEEEMNTLREEMHATQQRMWELFSEQSSDSQIQQTLPDHNEDNLSGDVKNI
ncbi:MAG TPA: hypothetical protein VKY82_09415 [Flavobacterium sp.]|nr:hypothetical protein [Flavobacterium sp.]